MAIAKRFKIPTLAIGSSIVAFGASMPEFGVSIHYTIHASMDVVFGNGLGLTM